MEVRYLKIRNYQKPTVLCLVVFLASLPFVVSAQEVANYVPLVEGIPGVSGAGNMEEYISALYRLSISIAALLAVIKIIFGGVKYMLSDVITDKSDAKKDIRGALLGLLIVLGAVLILNTINPRLTDFDIFEDKGSGLISNREKSLNVANDGARVSAGEGAENTANLPEDLPEGTTTSTCEMQGGPRKCQAEIERCAEGGKVYNDKGSLVAVCN